MKKSLSLLAAIGFMGVLCAGENLLPNENALQINAENKPEGWGGKVNPESGVDTVITPAKGVNSMRMVGKEMLETRVKVKGGHVYKVSFVLKTENFKWLTAASFQIIWMEKGKYLLTDYQGKKVWNMVTKNVQGGHNWDLIELPGIVAPPEADSAIVRFGQVFDPSGIFWISQWRMEETEKGDNFQNRIAAIPRAPAGMTLDRAFDESVWNNAAKLSGYLLPTSGINAKFSTETYVMYDQDALWLLFRNFQPNSDKLIDNDMKRFDAQDANEIFLKLPDQKLQYHAILSVSGKLWLGRESWDDPNWPKKRHPWEKDGITFKIKQYQDRWISAMRIPFSGLSAKAPENRAEWRANFCRTVHSDAKEETAWPFLREAMFQFTPDFGKIIFTESTFPQVRNVSISTAGATAELHNASEKPAKVTVAFVKHNEDQAFVEKSITRELAAGGHEIWDLPHQQETDEMRFVEIRSDGNLIAKYSGKPLQEYFIMGVYDPEKVRTQTQYLAVDSPFFLAFNLRHNFPSKDKSHKLILRKESAFDLYMEVPAELTFSGMTIETGNWLRIPLIKPSSVTTAENGKSKIYKFELPAILDTREPYFLFFYECNAPENREYTGSWHIVCNNEKVLPKHELRFRTMKVGALKKPFEKMVVNPGLLTAKTMRWWFPKDTIKHYKRLGFNRIEVVCSPTESMEYYTGSEPVTYEQFYDLILKEMRDSGEKLFISTFITSSGARGWYWTDKDPDARAVSYDGKQVPNQYGYPSLCPSYRGKYYKEWGDFLVNSSVFKKYRSTWLGLDMELWPPDAWEKTCFCKRCLAAFRDYCIKEKRQDYLELDPAKVIKEGKDQDFAKFWNEFKRDLYADFISATARIVQKSVEGEPSTSPLDKFTVSDWTSPDSQIRDDVLDYFEVAFFNSPDNNFAKMLSKMTRWNFRKDLYCSTTYGQTSSCPDFHVTHEQVKENLFECAAFGMQGVSWYYAIYLEPRRMKAIIDGLNAIRPFEDLVISGKYSNEIRSSNPKQQLTRLSLGNEALLGVRAYGAQDDLTGTIRLGTVSEVLSIYDCETKEKLGTVTPENPEFLCKVRKNRIRLLYAGPDKKWSERQKIVSE